MWKVVGLLVALALMWLFPFPPAMILIGVIYIFAVTRE